MNFNLGVPQGSSMGSSMGLLVVNELLNDCQSNKYKVIVYADDIGVLMTATASLHFKELAKEPLIIIENWGNKYKLLFSIDKCNFMLFKRGKRITHMPTIKLMNHSIKYCKELKHLGLMFDNNFSWIPHITYLKHRTDNMLY